LRDTGRSIPSETYSEIALDGRNALGGNQADPRRLDPCSCWFSLDRKALKILCSAVDFAPRSNVSLRDIVGGHLVASAFCSASQIGQRPRDRKRCNIADISRRRSAGVGCRPSQRNTVPIGAGDGGTTNVVCSRVIWFHAGTANEMLRRGPGSGVAWAAPANPIAEAAVAALNRAASPALRAAAAIAVVKVLIMGVLFAVHLDAAGDAEVN
jgi:hypothetical protein